MSTLLEQHGAQPQKQPKYVPVFMDREFSGLYTQRNVLHDPSDVVTTKYYGGRPDALWMGKNVELTNRLTLQRRPGHAPFSTATYPTPPNRAFSFQLTDGTIQVIVDTGSTGSMAVTSVGNSSAGVAVYVGTFPGGGSNAYVNLIFQIAGFAGNNNNGTYTCTASSTTNLTLSNATATAETLAATAISAGAVYYDTQSGGVKTLLFAKSVGAGQTYFIAVAGVLYMGDGVDTKKYTPGNVNGTIWNWGIAAPITAPSVTIVSSGSAAVPWVASTVFSTMGLIDDGTNIQQLISVNASGTNATRLGTSSNGEPAWNLTPGATTTDGAVTWTNFGPIGTWAAHETILNFSIGGNLTSPCMIYDPVSQTLQGNTNSGAASGVTGVSKPAFNASPGANTYDPVGNCPPGVKWITWKPGQNVGKWAPSTTYKTWGTGIPEGVIVPYILPPPTGTGAQPVFLMACTTGGVSGTGNNVPIWGTTAGNQTTDGDLIWVCLGSKTRVDNTLYSAWSTGSTTFSAIVVAGNFYVCTQTGTSKTGAPTFNTVYGSKTADGTAEWTCVGNSFAWAKATQWYLPVSGFAPSQPTQAYGGASVIDTNSDIEYVVASGKTGAAHPTWTGIGTHIADTLATPLVLTQVGIVGTTVTYTGTITGGAANALAGQTFLILGFVNVENNGLITVTSSTATTLVCTANATPQINETHAGTATSGLIWYNQAAAATNSLAWSFNKVYGYSYKARPSDDYYVTNVPPGANPSMPLGVYKGGGTNAISTSSPALTLTGSNVGAVNTVSGLGSTDPQVDTIIIWRAPDGASPADMLELTEIPNPAPVGGVAQPWSFKDYLPDTPTSLYPGLDALAPAPIDDSNDPPPSTYLPMVYNYQRIWGANGESVPFSGGPDVITGNPNEAFAPADELPFLAPVVRLVRTPQGIITFLTDSIELIGGGPLTASFYSITIAPGIGLQSYNALDVLGGEIYFFSSDNQFRAMTPSLYVPTVGFPLGDQFANLPSSGISDATWNPANVYVAVHQNGIDNCVFVADGSTGWYRLNPYQVPGSSHGPEPVWSPFANITSGCKMVQSVETAPGVKKLLVGATTANQKILYRDLTVYQDNGSSYDAWFTMGSITLAHPGQLALMAFLEFDFSGVSYRPTISYLLNEISGTFTPFTTAPVFDPPSLYGQTIAPASYSPNRYYFNANAGIARCRHLQIKVDFGTTAVGDELYNLTIFGRLTVE